MNWEEAIKKTIRLHEIALKTNKDYEEIKKRYRKIFYLASGCPLCYLTDKINDNYFDYDDTCNGCIWLKMENKECNSEYNDDKKSIKRLKKWLRKLDKKQRETCKKCQYKIKKNNKEYCNFYEDYCDIVFTLCE